MLFGTLIFWLTIAQAILNPIMLATACVTNELRESDPDGYDVPPILAGCLIFVSLFEAVVIAICYAIDQLAPCPYPAYILFGIMLATTWLCIEGFSYLIRNRTILPNPREPEPRTFQQINPIPAPAPVMVETPAGLIASGGATRHFGVVSMSSRSIQPSNNQPITAASLERPRTILRKDDK